MASPAISIEKCSSCRGTGKAMNDGQSHRCLICDGIGHEEREVGGSLRFVLIILIGIAVGFVVGQNVFKSSIMLAMLTNFAVVGVFYFIAFYFDRRSISKARAERLQQWDPGVPPLERNPIAKTHGRGSESWHFSGSAYPENFPSYCPCCAAVQERPEALLRRITEHDIHGFNYSAEQIRATTWQRMENDKKVGEYTTFTTVKALKKVPPVDQTKVFAYCKRCRTHIQNHRPGFFFRLNLLLFSLGVLIAAGPLAIFPIQVQMQCIGVLVIYAALLLFALWLKRLGVVSSLAPECSHVAEPLRFHRAKNIYNIFAANPLWARELQRLNPPLQMVLTNEPVEIKLSRQAWLQVAGALCCAGGLRWFFSSWLGKS